MEKLNNFFTIVAHGSEIGLNSDLLETGLFNILGLLVILFIFGGQFLNDFLSTRLNNIKTTVKDAEDRLSEAQTRLNDAKKQLDQMNVIIEEIRQETISTKKALLQSDIFQAKKDLKIRFERALATFRSKERQIFLEIKQQIILLVLKRTVIRAKETFNPKDRASALIVETINKLEGDLL